MIHLTGDTIWKSIKKRINYMNIHHVGLSDLRRYKVFDASKSGDVMKLVLTVILTSTLIEPTLRAILGFIRTKNINWFYHPLISFLITQSYGLSFLKR